MDVQARDGWEQGLPAVAQIDLHGQGVEICEVPAAGTERPLRDIEWRSRQAGEQPETRLVRLLWLPWLDMPFRYLP